jgi:hypothetical protein
MTAYIDSSAVISECKRYRYALHRIWDRSKSVACVIGLNPSTADSSNDDPTIRRCVGYAKLFGYGGFIMVNLFAYRATDPKEIKRLPIDIAIGPENDIYLRRITLGAKTVIAAWGSHGDMQGRGKQVMRMLREQCKVVYCFNTKSGYKTKNGQPKHPLYLPGDANLVEIRYVGQEPVPV